MWCYMTTMAKCCLDHMNLIEHRKYKCNKKWHKNKLTYGDVPLSGLQPLRRLYYKINESTVPATLRMGITKNNESRYLENKYQHDFII